MSIKEKQIKFNKQLSNLKRKCRFKECIFPDKSTCSSKTIKAHSIQRNKVLKNISERGMVISGDIQKTLFTREFEKVGINSASTFFGFCNYHDALIFSEIENSRYKGSQEQNFLFAYRACCLEYVKKKEDCCFYKSLLKRYANTSKEIHVRSKLYEAQVGLSDLTNILEYFSNELIKQRDLRNFKIINTATFSISYESLIAVNSLFFLHYDFQGNLINDLSDPSKVPAPIFLNVFPENGKTIILLSYLTDDVKTYRNILHQLNSFSHSEIENFFSNLIITHCENFFISPLKYKKISKKLRRLFVSKFMNTLTKPYDSDYLSKRTINLFKRLKK